MEYNNTINKLSKNFNAITDIIRKFQKKKILVDKKLNELKDLYKSTIKKNNKKIFLFCLDSCHYQFKSFKMDLDHIEEKRKFIINRIYCDYYKLYQVLLKYLEENEKNDTENELQKNTFPVYKDLDTLAEYKLSDIIGLHEILLTNIKNLTEKYLTQKEQIEHYYDTNKVGFSISHLSLIHI